MMFGVGLKSPWRAERKSNTYDTSLEDETVSILKAAAEKRGNPKDLQSYLAYQHEGLAGAPFIPPMEVLETSKTRVVAGIQICPFADSIRKITELFPDYVDQDMLEVVASRCKGLDSGRVNGFNPDIKFKHTHFKLGDLIGNPPSKGCYFEFEVEE